MGSHEKPKEEAEMRDWLGWIHFLRKGDPEPVPAVRARPCIICDTYKERGLYPPAGHQCTPVSFVDKPVVRIVGRPASPRPE